MAIEYKKALDPTKEGVTSFKVIGPLPKMKTERYEPKVYAIDEYGSAGAILQMRVPKALREEFAAVCKRNGITASEALRQFMCDYVDGK